MENNVNVENEEKTINNQVNKADDINPELNNQANKADDINPELKQLRIKQILKKTIISSHINKSPYNISKEQYGVNASFTGLNFSTNKVTKDGLGGFSKKIFINNTQFTATLVIEEDRDNPFDSYNIINPLNNCYQGTKYKDNTYKIVLATDSKSKTIKEFDDGIESIKALIILFRNKDNTTNRIKKIYFISNKKNKGVDNEKDEYKEIYNYCISGLDFNRTNKDSMDQRNYMEVNNQLEILFNISRKDIKWHIICNKDKTPHILILESLKYINDTVYEAPSIQLGNLTLKVHKKITVSIDGFKDENPFFNTTDKSPHNEAINNNENMNDGQSGIQINYNRKYNSYKTFRLKDTGNTNNKSNTSNNTSKNVNYNNPWALKNPIIQKCMEYSSDKWHCASCTFVQKINITQIIDNKNIAICGCCYEKNDLTAYLVDYNTDKGNDTGYIGHNNDALNTLNSNNTDNSPKTSNALNNSNNSDNSSKTLNALNNDTTDVDTGTSHNNTEITTAGIDMEEKSDDDNSNKKSQFGKASGAITEDMIRKGKKNLSPTKQSNIKKRVKRPYGVIAVDDRERTRFKTTDNSVLTSKKKEKENENNNF